MAEELAPHSILPESWSVKEVVADLKADLKADQASTKTDIVSHLVKQDEMLTAISTKVDGKADKADLLALGTKIDGHGQRITTLEEHRTEELANSRFRRRVWAAIASVAGILAVLLGSLIAAHAHP